MVKNVLACDAIARMPVDLWHAHINIHRHSAPAQTSTRTRIQTSDLIGLLQELLLVAPQLGSHSGVLPQNCFPVLDLVLVGWEPGAWLSWQEGMSGLAWALGLRLGQGLCCS